MGNHSFIYLEAAAALFILKTLNILRQNLLPSC